MSATHASLMEKKAVDARPSLAGNKGHLDLVIRFPSDLQVADQDTEYCEILEKGQWRRVRLHDYNEIYNVPGLYEHIFYSVLQCTSPQRVVGLLSDVMKDWRQHMTSLSVLDVGAGNGMIGQELRQRGVRNLVGLDLIPEARTAAHRDRPGLYDDYLVADLTALDDAQCATLAAAEFNALCTVSALGFGDIPARAFANAYNYVSDGGWIAFNIKETFLSGDDTSGFCRLLRAMTDSQMLQMEAYRRYSHRLSIHGKPLKYIAMVGRKLQNVTEEMIAQAERGHDSI